MNSDVLIIGGGVIGLSLARALRQNGAGKIVVLERGTVGREASFAAAGMLAPQTECDRDDEFLRFCLESNRLYDSFAAALFAETGIDVELDRTGTLYAAFTDSDTEELNRRFAFQTGANLKVERVTAEQIRRSEPFISPDVREGLFFPEDGQVENRLVVQALEKFAELNEIEIVENAEVSNLLIEGEKVSGAATAGEKFFAGATVLATGAWTNLVKFGDADLFLPQIVPVRGQMLTFRTVKRFFGHVIDTPRGYLVPRRDGRILIGATVENAGFDKSVTKAGTEFLRECAAEISPSLENLEPAENWAGLRPRAADALPIIGKLRQAENLFVATAHYRNGILLAPLTAQILADKILNDADSPYLRAFGVERLRTASA